MQDQRSIHVANEIRRKLPARMVAEVKNLRIILVGEDTEKVDLTIRVKKMGYLEVHGEAPNIHMKDKIVSRIQEMSGGRQVVSHLTYKRDDPLKRRRGGLHNF